MAKRSPTHNIDARFSALLESRARGMRDAPTPPEARLWEAIRGQRLGTAFRRQVPIGRYIADFVAPRQKLVIEIDGAGHARRRHGDARRDQYMRRLGFRVLRIPSDAVHRELTTVLMRISAAFRENLG
jgi:very-short-patch-repair endonuclease